MKAPKSYLNERHIKDLVTISHLSQGLQLAPFTWRGNMFLNLSTLQRAACYHKDSTGIEIVHLYQDPNQHASLGI